MWLCRCTCGNEAVVQSAALKDKHSQSCGCLKVETVIKRSTTHGHATAGDNSPTYFTWAGMIGRCTNPKHAAFKYYGGRGIKVCKRWKDFSNFLADMGEKPPGTSIDRIDNSKGYTSLNCEWRTPKQQGRNKSNNRILTVDGISKPESEWVEEAGINRGTLSDRLSNGWSHTEAVKTPAGTNTNNTKSRMLTHDGKTMCISEWARLLDLHSAAISQRLHRGASDSEALKPKRTVRPIIR